MKKLRTFYYSTKNAMKKGCWKLNRANLCRLWVDSKKVNIASGNLNFNQESENSRCWQV